MTSTDTGGDDCLHRTHNEKHKEEKKKAVYVVGKQTGRLVD
jgi:hypothetical protein